MNVKQDEEMAEMRKLAGLPERAVNHDDFMKSLSDEEREEYEKREADPDSLTGSPAKVFKNLSVLSLITRLTYYQESL